MKTYAFAKCRPLALKQIALEEGFWKDLVVQSRERGLPSLLEEYEGRNIVGNFKDAASGQPRAQEENANNYDEFLFKALEACNFHLGQAEDAGLRETYERIRDWVLAAQEEDGYLNTLARQTGTPRHSAETSQELYACGHLIQAGLAEKRLTGEDRLFRAARRYIDCLIEGYGLDGRGLNRFGIGEYGKMFKWPDHPNVEMALVELYRETGDARYLGFCEAILEFSDYRRRSQMTNHAVCELLQATGGVDYYLETGDRTVWEATVRLWEDLLRKVYVTGGVGSTHRGTTTEAVGKEYALVSDQAYTETCAAISLVFWSWRMFLASGESSYLDFLERAFLNGVLVGMSVKGTEYFYENPLEYQAVWVKGSASLEEVYADFRMDRGVFRKAYHGCSCCPPNVQRLLASLQQYFYAFEGDRIWCTLYGSSRVELELESGIALRLVQETDYPRGGEVSVRVELEEEAEFTVCLRIPEWSQSVSLEVNGQAYGAEQKNGFLVIRRSWARGDTIFLDLGMRAYLEQSHPKHMVNYEKLTIRRGPYVYCLEGIDNPDVDLFGVVLPQNTVFKEEPSEWIPGGVELVFEGMLRDDGDWNGRPYQAYPTETAVELNPVRLRAIPHFAWANREKASMVTALPFV